MRAADKESKSGKEKEIVRSKAERKRKSSVVCGVTENIRHQMREEESRSTWLTLCSDRKHMYEEKNMQ